MPKPYVIDPDDVIDDRECCVMCGGPNNNDGPFCEECDEDTEFEEVEADLIEDWDAFGDHDAFC